MIVKIKFGSHLYGTDTASSDADYKSVYIPSARDILLQRAGSPELETLGSKRDKAEGEKNQPGDTDSENYSLQKYLRLLAEGQTVAVDMLFAPKPLLTSELWEAIQKNKHRLLTKRSAAFVGYCRQQANKYGIKGSRVAEAKNAAELFEKLRFENGPQAKVGEFFAKAETPLGDHTRVLRKDTPQNREEWYYECCNRMVGFNNTVKEAATIFRRIYDAYGNRAKLAESNEGIDWKALSHAVRVGHEALELLKTHQITFPLPNAKHVLDIKLGKLPYNDVAKEIEELLVAVEENASISTLPDDPDREYMDYLVLTAYGSQVVKGGWL